MQYYLGVDGGASKCTVQLEDESGTILGRATSGPANIRISVPDAWKSIQAALQQALHNATITLNNTNCQIHAGIGIAGCEIQDAFNEFLQYPHNFTTIAVTNDAHTACLGAHGGKDGALIIAGTGVVGYQIENSCVERVAGWGFPHDDIGSGAWLGLEATRMTVQAYDGRQEANSLTNAVLAYFDGDFNALVSWANSANSTVFAQLAPIVVRSAHSGDTHALQILQRAARALDAVGDALLNKQQDISKPLPCVIIGGIAPFIEPYLHSRLQSRLRPALQSPEAGAILYIKQEMQSKEYS